MLHVFLPMASAFLRKLLDDVSGHAGALRLARDNALVPHFLRRHLHQT